MFASIQKGLRYIQMSHTDCGNKLMDEVLETFQIWRSLSMKSCPYDNAVAEATFKITKTDFIKGQRFKSLTDLERELRDDVH
ncbi:hypothetical protein MUG87_15175 [Ectobacillus sp. JY-23]|uniref:hypothetical protein n=1 Tax=Ectobacillus sp. JY-23 TaxID=2933872 RepID=UPI001FF35484|nr:hypothetical protein [Ectobacillus sp. JY-23]UOY91819.1 hypothetical protein MUG87_15175 [Ectobacillus sp. JY-23]